MHQELIEYLSEFVSERRKNRLQEVLSQRTRHMTIVLEDIYQAHNASAVLRSCDCFGIQDVHFIENKHHFKISEDVSMGSTQWLSIHKYRDKENNTIRCLKSLKQKGYRIVATTPHKDDCFLDELKVDSPFALVFGTEIKGISAEVSEIADEFVRIPMYGFTESFNISVSAALCMYELTKKIRANAEINWELKEKEKGEIYLDWLRCSVKHANLLEKRYLEEFKSKNVP